MAERMPTPVKVNPQEIRDLHAQYGVEQTDPAFDALVAHYYRDEAEDPADVLPLPQTSAEVAELVDAVEQKVVPRSIHQATATVERLQTADRALQEDPKDIATELLDGLHAVASNGLNNWRLDQKDRARWAKITGMRTAKELDHEMHSYMDALSPDPEQETSTVKFKRLVSQAHDRLKLDDEIATHQAAAAAKREYEPGEVVAKLGKNGRRVWKADENGKLRPMRMADVLAYYGREGQEQPKPAVDDSAEAGTAKAEKQRKPLVNPDPEGIPQDVWDTGLTEEEKHRAIKVVKEQERRDAELDAYNKPWKDLTEEQRDIIFENMKKRREEAAQARAEVTEPVTDAEPKGMRARIRRMMQKAHARLTTYTTKTFEYYQDEEKGKRRAAVSGVVGALAAAGTVYLMYKLGSAPSGSGNHQQLADGSGVLDGSGKGHPFGPGSVTTNGHPAELGDFNTGTAIDKAGKTAAKAHEYATLHNGDTYWSTAEQELIRRGNPHPSVIQIDALKDDLLDINSVSEEEARHLPIGTRIKLR